MKLIDKHFKHEIFNRKTLKISYSGTKNIFARINNHKEIISDNNNYYSKQNECNYKTRMNCPMNGLCNLDNVVYQGIIYPTENVKDRKTYIGISSTKWKSRYANHKFSFSHEHLKNQTAPSKHFWILKNKCLTPEIQWSILNKSNTPKCFDNRCNLCLEEKIQLMIYPDPEKLLSQRCELIVRCRQRNKFKQ